MCCLFHRHVSGPQFTILQLTMTQIVPRVAFPSPWATALPIFVERACRSKDGTGLEEAHQSRRGRYRWTLYASSLPGCCSVTCIAMPSRLEEKKANSLVLILKVFLRRCRYSCDPSFGSCTVCFQLGAKLDIDSEIQAVPLYHFQSCSP